MCELRRIDNGFILETSNGTFVTQEEGEALALLADEIGIKCKIFCHDKEYISNPMVFTIGNLIIR